ncbi:hypothetical protein [Stenotrophomonas sp. RAC2]|uniref:hypothetical protein n=1 Tax=Stenotrophomonas sp. RAC2 TaxID=3064902 RepID=UPI002721D8AF|nr:hypothetical protein [Stenotrophomonas sp. RAC2]MDV9040997.1 hypothetical protein [Stenotrophomonas sp. RAC2]
MSAHVDVLAVMDIAATSIEHSGGNVAYLRQARAAVAELIEASGDALQATPGASQINANTRLMAALARVNGGAA